jgi:peptide/nickel transport system permease protein
LAGFIVSRLAQTLVVIFIVSIMAFSLLQIVPGDPARALLGGDAPQGQIDALRRELWLDRPVTEQYVHWLGNALHGDFGRSFNYREDVAGLLARRLPVTAYLGVIALVLSILLGISAGITAAVRRGTFLDSALSLIATAGFAIPVFWLGIIFIYLAGFQLRWLPIQGFTWPAENLGKSLSQTVMPVICLSVTSMAILSRQTRSSMLEVLRQDYIRTARAKGLKAREVILKHGLRNALIPVVTLLAIQLRVLIGGAVLVETVFGIPGLGKLLVDSVITKDILVVQAGVLVISAITCLANLAVDISYGWLDPRTRLE